MPDQERAHVYVIAEAGINHGGDMDVAARMVRVAKEAGADAVKFQSFSADSLAHAGLARDQYDFFKRYELSIEEHASLAKLCREQRIDFLSTPFDFRMVDLLVELGASAIKIASSDLTFLPLIEYAAAKGKPMFISTGMGNLDEARAACDTARRAGAPRVVLLQCTTNYPTAYPDVNLRAMLALREHVRCEVGFSDHSIGNFACFGAVALGAAVIEKHFCLDKSQPGPDIPGSADLGQLKDLVLGIRSLEAALGTGVKQMRDSEKEVAAIARRSIFYTADLPAGHVLNPSSFTFLRPGTGLSPAAVSSLLGKTLKRDVQAGEMAEPSDVE